MIHVGGTLAEIALSERSNLVGSRLREAQLRTRVGATAEHVEEQALAAGRNALD